MWGGVWGGEESAKGQGKGKDDNTKGKKGAKGAKGTKGAKGAKGAKGTKGKVSGTHLEENEAPPHGDSQVKRTKSPLPPTSYLLPPTPYHELVPTPYACVLPLPLPLTPNT
jgi:hypothetical protein